MKGKYKQSTSVFLPLISKDIRNQKDSKSKISNPLSLGTKLNSKQYFQSRKKGLKVDALAHEGEEGRK